MAVHPLTFDEVLVACKALVLRFCSIYTTNEEDRKDLFQEILFHIWKALPTYKGEAQITTWVYKVALRVALRFHDKEQRRKTVHQSFNAVHTMPVAEAPMMHEASLQHLRACITQLDDVNKLLVSLYLEDLPYRQIGEIMGISENHVAVKMRRVKKLLSNCMQS